LNGLNEFCSIARRPDSRIEQFYRSVDFRGRDDQRWAKAQGALAAAQ
jgi:hypothetical protein